MKTIIDGKLFDTEKMELIGEHSFSISTDFRHFEESLYKSKKGTYVLFGSGGPMSKYAEYKGNGSTGGGSREDILDDSEAYEWAERYLETEDILKHFPDCVQEG